MGIDILFVIKAIIIAIVEGITEFIPISSTGHMILIGDMIGFKETEFTKMFEVVIQLGAILAIVVIYWQKFKTNIVELFKKDKDAIHFWLILIVGVIPFGVIGFLFYDTIKEKLFTTNTVIIGFIVGGILLLIAEYYNKKLKRALADEINEISIKQTLIVGMFQCLAVWPGMSRSASTIIGGWIAGISTTVAAEFSFFLALPVMFGASAVDLVKYDYSKITLTEVTALVVGFIVAFIVSILVVEKFIAFLQKKPMKVFSIYRIVAGCILAVCVLTNVIN